MASHPRTRWEVKLTDSITQLCPSGFALEWPVPHYVSVLGNTDLLLHPAYGSPSNLILPDALRFSVSQLPNKPVNNAKGNPLGLGNGQAQPIMAVGPSGNMDRPVVDFIPDSKPNLAAEMERLSAAPDYRWSTGVIEVFMAQAWTEVVFNGKPYLLAVVLTSQYRLFTVVADLRAKQFAVKGELHLLNVGLIQNMNAAFDSVLDGTNTNRVLLEQQRPKCITFCKIDPTILAVGCGDGSVVFIKLSFEDAVAFNGTHTFNVQSKVLNLINVVSPNPVTAMTWIGWKLCCSDGSGRVAEILVHKQMVQVPLQPSLQLDGQALQVQQTVTELGVSAISLANLTTTYQLPIVKLLSCSLEEAGKAIDAIVAIGGNTISIFADSYSTNQPSEEQINGSLMLQADYLLPNTITGAALFNYRFSGELFKMIAATDCLSNTYFLKMNLPETGASIELERVPSEKVFFPTQKVSLADAWRGFDLEEEARKRELERKEKDNEIEIIEDKLQDLYLEDLSSAIYPTHGLVTSPNHCMILTLHTQLDVPEIKKARVAKKHLIMVGRSLGSTLDTLSASSTIYQQDIGFALATGLFSKKYYTAGIAHRKHIADELTRISSRVQADANSSIIYPAACQLGALLPLLELPVLMNSENSGLKSIVSVLVEKSKVIRLKKLQKHFLNILANNPIVSKAKQGKGIKDENQITKTAFLVAADFVLLWGHRQSFLVYADSKSMESTKPVDLTLDKDEEALKLSNHVYKSFGVIPVPTNFPKREAFWPGGPLDTKVSFKSHISLSGEVFLERDDKFSESFLVERCPISGLILKGAGFLICPVCATKYNDWSDIAYLRNQPDICIFCDVKLAPISSLKVTNVDAPEGTLTWEELLAFQNAV